MQEQQINPISKDCAKAFGRETTREIQTSSAASTGCRCLAVDVWRVLHMKRDIPAWMLDEKENSN
jgi:hypothetical protein